jgi:hypothetical protein
VLFLTNYGTSSSWTRDQIEEMAKRLLLGVALPVAVMHSRILQEVSESVFRQTPLSQRPHFKRPPNTGGSGKVPGSNVTAVARVTGRKRRHNESATSDKSFTSSSTTDDNEEMDHSTVALSNVPMNSGQPAVYETPAQPSPELPTTSIGLSAYFDKHAHLFSLLQVELNDFDRRQSSALVVPSTLGAATRTDGIVGKLLLVTT